MVITLWEAAGLASLMESSLTLHTFLATLTTLPSPPLPTQHTHTHTHTHRYHEVKKKHIQCVHQHTHNHMCTNKSPYLAAADRIQTATATITGTGVDCFFHSCPCTSCGGEDISIRCAFRRQFNAISRNSVGTHYSTRPCIILH